MPPRVKLTLCPSTVNADMIRPEFNRCLAFQSFGDDNNIYAVSTGLQQSSRLISTCNANVLAVIPASKTGKYECNGNTIGYMIGKIHHASKEKLAEIRKT